MTLSYMFGTVVHRNHEHLNFVGQGHILGQRSMSREENVPFFDSHRERERNWENQFQQHEGKADLN